MLRPKKAAFKHGSNLQLFGCPAVSDRTWDYLA
jgi:hypothetical protein